MRTHTHTSAPCGRRALAAVMAGLALVAATPAAALAEGGAAGQASGSSEMEVAYEGRAWEGNASITVPTDVPLYVNPVTGNFVAPTNVHIQNTGADCAYVSGVKATMQNGFEATTEDRIATAEGKAAWLRVSQAGSEDGRAAFTLDAAAATVTKHNDATGEDETVVTGATLRPEAWVLNPKRATSTLLAFEGGMSAAGVADLGLTPDMLKGACSLSWEFGLSARATSNYLDSASVPVAFAAEKELDEYTVADMSSVSAYLSHIKEMVDIGEATQAQLEEDDVYATFSAYAKQGATWKAFNFGTGYESVNVRVVGVLHDAKAQGGGMAGLTLMTEAPVAQSDMYPSRTSDISWSGSTMRNVYLSSAGKIGSLIPQELRKEAVAVTKRNAVRGDTETKDLFWLPSASELGFTGVGDEGATYPYFEGATQATRCGALKGTQTYVGEADVWLRSPDETDKASFHRLFGDGTLGRRYAEGDKFLVVLGFSL